MPEKKETEVLKLPPEMRTRLDGLRADIKKARHGVKVMKDMGMDVTDIESKLEWAEGVRSTLLKEFD